MRLRALRRQWESLARRDPMWAICSDPAKRGNTWDADEFFASGVEEAHGVIEAATAILPSLARGRFLDFGCGMGRVTIPLGSFFDEGDGVDISDTMVRAAQARSPDPERYRFHVNSAPDLRLFPDDHFDFVYSRITLQHIPPSPAKGYIGEFVRVLAPGGLALFQIPARPPAGHRGSQRAVYRRVRDLWYSLKGLSDLAARSRLYAVSREDVLRVVESGGGTVLRVSPDASLWGGWESYLYAVTTH